MTNYKIVIPSAGMGNRIGPYSKFFNKALVTIGDKPAIARVIEKFGVDKTFLIILGYRADQVKEALCAIFPHINFEFVNVKLFEGLGSGLGWSLLQAKDKLQCPFIFIPNDTVIGKDQIDLDPTLIGNWLGYYKKNDGDGYHYDSFRTVNLNHEGLVTSINGKGINNDNLYTGICGVKDYKTFWKSFLNDVNHVPLGEVVGLKGLNEIKAVQIEDWFDCGNLKTLSIAKKSFANPDVNILEKEDETIWFVDNKVIKFSNKKKFIQDRIRRASYLPSKLFPSIISHGEYHYSYKKVSGSVYADKFTEASMVGFMDICNQFLWSDVKGYGTKEIELCYDFYKEKTNDRLQHYLTRFEQTDNDVYINDVFVPKVASQLESLDWKNICETIHWSRFHGDLHGENILHNNENYILIDWRQNFGGASYDFGDAYYDFSKIHHGLLVNHGVVAKNEFDIVEANSTEIFLTINRKSNLIEAENGLKLWLLRNRFDLNKVNILTALIFINIAGLHDFPYAKFLFNFGRLMLARQSINKKN
jgi:NDP-sugar pyrophosphorylase family protein